ncbi:hypothetical protein MITS9508_00564 [Synechococcus sp. MIT S9508]|nr:hypothetical protein MITS9508_00564 [Synechococcus sp. MIT S9508]
MQCSRPKRGATKPAQRLEPQAAAHVKSLGIRKQLLPGKDEKVLVKQPLNFCGRNSP